MLETHAFDEDCACTACVLMREMVRDVVPEIPECQQREHIETLRRTWVPGPMLVGDGPG